MSELRDLSPGCLYSMDSVTALLFMTKKPPLLSSVLHTLEYGCLRCEVAMKSDTIVSAVCELPLREPLSPPALMLE